MGLQLGGEVLVVDGEHKRSRENRAGAARSATRRGREKVPGAAGARQAGAEVPVLAGARSTARVWAGWLLRGDVSLCSGCFAGRSPIRQREESQVSAAAAGWWEAKEDGPGDWGCLDGEACAERSGGG